MTGSLLLGKRNHLHLLDCSSGHAFIELKKGIGTFMSQRLPSLKVVVVVGEMHSYPSTVVVMEYIQNDCVNSFIFGLLISIQIPAL